ncbi:hypothetical protein ACOZ4I_00970 [Haloarcula salina]|uniref:hypothetical protein n=1 Tax=Haloarcula salina TaxID=1429914 RepID=UPI003C6EC4F8
MRLTRRGFVAGVCALGSGCVGFGDSSTPTPRPDRDGDGAPDHADDYPGDERRAFRSFQWEGTATLEPGEFQAVALTNSERASGDFLDYEVSVHGETPVDCLVFERDAYDRYQDGARDVSVVSAYSRVGVTDASVTEQLARGEYLFALDYTDQSTAPGTAPVEVSITLELGEALATETE